MSMIEPEIAKLLEIEGVDSRFTLCAIVSKRARQLTDELFYAEKECKDVTDKTSFLELPLFRKHSCPFLELCSCAK